MDTTDKNKYFLAKHVRQKLMLPKLNLYYLSDKDPTIEYKVIDGYRWYNIDTVEQYLKQKRKIHLTEEELERRKNSVCYMPVVDAHILKYFNTNYPDTPVIIEECDNKKYSELVKMFRNIKETETKILIIHKQQFQAGPLNLIKHIASGNNVTLIIIE